MDDNVGAVVERAQQNWCGDRVVDDQGNAGLVGYFCERFEVANVPGRISDALAEEARVLSSIGFSIAAGSSLSANRALISI